MNHFPHAWGRPRDDVYGAYNPGYLQTTGPKTHTQSPTVTGTSVIAVKFKDGVVIAADNLASYGSLARFTDVQRLRPFNSKVCLGFGGDVSDMQALDRMLNSLSIRENYHSGEGDPYDTPSAPTPSSSDAASADASTHSTSTQLNARNLHTWLQKQMYHRRSQLNPLWNVILIAGLDGKDEPFLASVDLLGTTFTSPTLATGFGAHLAQPILRNTVPDEESATKLGREEAEKLVRECMKVLFYRDARSMDQFTIATVTKENGVQLQRGQKLEGQSWAFAETITGYGTQTV